MNRGMPGSPVVFAYSGEDVISFVPWPLPPSPALRWTRSLYEAFDHAMLALGRLDAVQRSDKRTPKLLPEWLIQREALMGLAATGAGHRLSLTDLLMTQAWHTDPKVAPVTLLTAQSAVEALRLGLALSEDGMLPTSDVLKRVQRVLTGVAKRRKYGGSTHLGIPGEFRHSYIWTGMLNRTKRPNLRSPPSRVPGSMQSLDEFVLDNRVSTPALLKTALAHAQFDLIYPFADDGPRVNLIYAAMLLRSSGLVKGPVLQLSDHISRDRPAYIDAMDKVLQYGDWEGYLQYFAEVITAAAESTADLILRVTELLESHRMSVDRLGRVASSSRAVLECFTYAPVRTPKDLQGRTGLSASPVSHALRNLQRLGIVRELTGFRRHRLYRYEPLTKLLSHGTDRIVMGPRRDPRLLGGNARNLRAHRP